MAMERQEIVIGTIQLDWSDWFAWNDLNKDARRDKTAVKIPTDAGVYEAKGNNDRDRLTIGMGSNLRSRISQGLVKGRLPHSEGIKIRAHEDTSNILVRWAITTRPAAVEEYLLHKYRETHEDQLPKYCTHGPRGSNLSRRG